MFKRPVPFSRSRRYFIGGSDARIIMGDDEAALLRLWREKRGEAEPVDLSGNLIVQLGAVTEELNRRPDGGALGHHRRRQMGRDQDPRRSPLPASHCYRREKVLALCRKRRHTYPVRCRAAAAAH